MDGLEKDLAGRATVLRIDLLSSVGREAAQEYGVKIVPTTLLFGGNGELIHRQTGRPDADVFRAKVEEWHTH
ncbi:MAG: thioredoxin family protein [Anaerolineae bacterium]|nr:thioredoxin family protein [Anaerolineae bacterium]